MQKPAAADTSQATSLDRVDGHLATLGDDVAEKRAFLGRCVRKAENSVANAVGGHTDAFTAVVIMTGLHTRLAALPEVRRAAA